MARSFWKWSLLTCWIVGSLIALNAIRFNPMTLTLRVVAETTAESMRTTTTQPANPDRTFNSAHSLADAEMAVDEPENTTGADHDSIAFVVHGEFVQLLPESPATVAIPGVIKGTVKLSNPYGRFWRVTIEGTVVLANGTTQQVLNPRTLWMPPNQTLQRPVQLQIDSKNFMPGLTQFRAILKDDQGKIIDQASVAFTLTVDFP